MRSPHKASSSSPSTCNSPLCAPSRFSFLAGQLPSRIGAYDNAAEFPAAIPTFAHYMRIAGYQTALAGKMHFCGPDQLHGFEERLTTDIYPADFGWTPDWTRFDERPGWYHTMDSVTQAGPCTRTNQIDFDDEVVFATKQKLFGPRAQPRPTPLLSRRIDDPTRTTRTWCPKATGIATRTEMRSTCRESATSPAPRRPAFHTPASRYRSRSY